MNTEWTTLQAKPENLLNSVLSSVRMPSEYLSDLPHTWQMYSITEPLRQNLMLYFTQLGKEKS